MKDKPIVSPQAVKGFREKKALFIPYDPPSFPIRSMLQRESVGHREFPGCILYRMDGAVVVYGAIGAPHTALWMETLIAGGTESFLLLGFCGSLNPPLSIGQTVLLTSAFSDEGTSPHYDPSSNLFFPSPDFQEEMTAVLREGRIPVLSGAAVSTDAPYRETVDWIRKWTSQKADVVDMEAAAFFCVANYHGCRAVSLQIVSDELSESTWTKGFSSPLLAEAVQRTFYPFLMDDSNDDDHDDEEEDNDGMI
ncbi:MAG: nucleoside phosphorylase [Candidatus Aminicenantes bacterium]|nr:nucleoside phosphorylase [Candidatus Aminicenantes bacterium]